MLLINELSATGVGAHLSFGLLAGWWLPQDRMLRLAGSPALAPATWRELLLAEGFAPVVQPRMQDHLLGQQIILAQSDGWLRSQITGVPTSVQTLHRASAPPRISIAEISNSQPLSQGGEMIRPIQVAIPASPSPLKQAEVTEQMLKAHIRQIVVEAIAHSVKMDRASIDKDRSFAEYGVDSILAVGLINAINEQCGTTLPTTTLFDYNTLDQLIEHLVQEHRHHLAALCKVSVHSPEAGHART